MNDIVYLQKKKNEDYAEVQLVECKFNDEEYNKVELTFRKEPCMPRMINNICSYYPRTQLIVQNVKKYHDEKRSILILSDRREHLKLLEDMIGDVLQQGGDPPSNKIRKVIFKDNSGLNLSEKLSIVGQLIGRRSRVWPEDIYQCMLDMNEFGKKITWGRVAGLLDCSVRTVYRNLDNQLKQEKQKLNEEL